MDSPSEILKSGEATAVRVSTGRIQARTIAALCVATALCIACLILILQLWRADLRIPIYYGTQSDLTIESALIKDVVENGWYLRNPRLGAPGISEFYDFPLSNALHYAIMKPISFIVGSWGMTLNLYFFLGFVFSVWSALLVLRQLKVAYPLAIAAGLLFAFAPYHFYRSENHLRLSGYYMIPPMVLVLVWLLRRDIGKLWSPKAVVSAVVCALIGCSDIYYAFFAVLLLALTGLYGLLEDRSFQRVRIAAYLIAVTSAVVLLGLVPTLIYTNQHGKNAETAVRDPHEAENYAFKMTQLVFPVSGHRVPFLARAKGYYNNSHAPSPISEGDGSALGMTEAAGFVFLLLLPLTGFRGARHQSAFRALALLNLCAFLIGTVGGFGSIFAWLCSPQIRAYSRISIYIAFISIAAMALLADEFWQWWGTNRVRRGILMLALVPIAAGGILDQTTRANVPPHDYVKSLYRNDADFFARVERSLPESAMVLQLPYMQYPESGPVSGMAPYDPLRGYLHSTNLRWSYGAVKGRYTDAWLRDLESRPIEDIAEGAAVAGFSAIYLDRAGYSDGAAELESRLKSLLARRPIVSTNRRYAFYELSPVVERLHRTYSPEQRRNLQRAVSNPLLLRWQGQCSGLEGTPESNWRWCGPNGELALENASTETSQLDLTGGVVGIGGPSTVRINGLGVSKAIRVTASGSIGFSERITVPPGRHTIHFTSDQRGVFAPGDPRLLAFQIKNFRAAAVAPSGLEVTWGHGFYPEERTGATSGRWCSSEGRLRLSNRSEHTIITTIRMVFSTADPGDSNLRITGPDFSASARVNISGTAFSRQVAIPPGEYVLKFRSDAKPVASRGDPRLLVFRLQDFRGENPLLAPHLIEAN
jgi:hypothetical protein